MKKFPRKPGKTAALIASIYIMATPFALSQEASHPKTAPVGEAKSAKTKTLETGASMLQQNSP